MLQGAWLCQDGKTHWFILPDGKAYQNGIHLSGDTDLYLDSGTGTIQRYDGWQVDMTVSNPVLLVWKKQGDKLEWTRPQAPLASALEQHAALSPQQGVHDTPAPLLKRKIAGIKVTKAITNRRQEPP